ncbi:MAG: hypothetical protein NT005_03600 [Spirochaetes bacterium]|jgi:hypothetical protein|nr:hypothetical protein [Spirochaetota bacterium]
MPTEDKRIDIRKEFPGDEALQQIHLARKALLAAARRKRVTLGAYVRSLKLRSKSSTRA